MGERVEILDERGARGGFSLASPEYRSTPRLINSPLESNGIGGSIPAFGSVRMAKKKGEKYECKECGMVVVVEDVCDCDDCEIECCETPMKKVKAPAKKAPVKKAAAKKPVKKKK
jgi:hypothetical protein